MRSKTKMAIYRLKHFSQLDLLKRIHPENLWQFLRPFRDFFGQQGLKLPTRSSPPRLDYEQLIGILLAPAGELPADLVEALYFVDELACPEGQELLHQAFPGLDYLWRDSPADIAVKAWLSDPELVEQLHAEHRVAQRARLYESFLSPSSQTANWRPPSPQIIQAIERELDAWFLSRKRGRGTRVYPSPREHGYGFLIRHGEAYRREGALQQGRSTSIVYRPEKHDVLEFDPFRGEVRIHARSRRDKSVYRDIFARHLLGPQHHFQKLPKYTLEPLKRFGRMALACHDVPGLAWARLVSIEWHDNQWPRRYERHRGQDVLDQFELEGLIIPPFAEIIQARFELRLTHKRHLRRLTLEPPNLLRLTRDEEGKLLEEWLFLRGFINWEGKADADSSLLERA